MNRPAISTVLMAACLAIAMTVKQYYHSASPSQLRWVLAPTTALVCLVTPAEFDFSPAHGYVGTQTAVDVVPSCAGINFMIITFCMLAFLFLPAVRTYARGIAALALAGGVALVATPLVNASRIILAIVAPHPEVSGFLSADQIHRLEGISVYFTALSILYLVASRLRRHGSMDASHPLRARYFLVPLFWYAVVTIGIPVLRRSYRGNGDAFIEHALTVTVVPLFIVAFLLALCKGARMLRCASWRARASFAAIVLLLGVAYLAWSPCPPSSTTYDQEANGLWVEGRWYTGVDAHTGDTVHADEVDAFLDRLRKNHIRYVYVRAGKIAPSGVLEHEPSPLFFALQERAPDLVFLPWISGDNDRLALEDAQWRDRFVQAIGRLHARGVRGIHLNIEPIRDDDEDYVALLRLLRRQLDGEFFLSHATRRVSPWSNECRIMAGEFWSREFYRATMTQTDQGVLMGYNTTLQTPKLYGAYLRRQTEQLLAWATDMPQHHVVIGIPAYEKHSCLFNAFAENVPVAVQAVRAALENAEGVTRTSFEGIAVYADWHMDVDEWHQIQELWLRPSEAFSFTQPEWRERR